MSARNRLAWHVHLSVILLAATGGADVRPLNVSLRASLPSPSPLGTTVTWTAVVSDTSGQLLYRFRARARGANFRIIRDFSSNPIVDWSVTKHEGLYEIEVTVRD